MNINISILFCCFPTGYQVVVAVHFCSCEPEVFQELFTIYKSKNDNKTRNHNL